MRKSEHKLPIPDSVSFRLLSLTAISGEFPANQLNRLSPSSSYLETIVTSLKKQKLIRTYYRDKLRGYRLGPSAKSALLNEYNNRFLPYLTGDTETNRLKSEVTRRLRLHKIAQAYITMENAGVSIYPDEKPPVFSLNGYCGKHIEYPAFYCSREVKDLGIQTTKIQNSRFAGILLSQNLFVIYNSGASLMRWHYKSEMRVKALMWNVLCQQRLPGQYRSQDIQGIVLGDSIELAYQILNSTGGAKHNYFMLDGSYENFHFITNDHQGEVILALLCNSNKISELNRILSQDLIVVNSTNTLEQDAMHANGTPVLFAYSCNLPRIKRFDTSLELTNQTGTLICFDFQADILRRYCSERIYFETIDFEKFERRFFP